jgi:hypothetical protein
MLPDTESLQAMILCLSLMVSASAAGAASARGDESPEVQGPSTRPSSSVDTLIEELGDHRFRVRDQATTRLSEMGSVDMEGLISRYRKETGYEQKLRLRYVIESVYYRRLMAGQVGFLGVTMGIQPLPAVYDPRTGQTVECVVAERVLEDNAAARAGMRANDIILDFDGQPVEKLMNVAVPRPGRAAGGRAATTMSHPAIDAFTSHVKMREPGSHVTMRVLRAGEVRQVRVAPGEKPEAMVDPHTLSSTMLSGGRAVGFGIASGGLVVTHVPKRSWMNQAGLQVDDVIVGIDGQQMPAGVTPDMLCQALKMSGLGRRLVLDVRPLEQVKLNVTLGARDPDMMNPADWEDAQERFAAWWRDQVGEPSVRLRRPRTYAYYSPLMPSAPPTSDAEFVP